MVAKVFSELKSVSGVFPETGHRSCVRSERTPQVPSSAMYILGDILHSTSEFCPSARSGTQRS